MFAVKALVLSVLLVKIGGSELDFPPGFKFGVASAAYQVEGAWNVSDKSVSIWDHFTHNMPEKIRGGSTGDIACDSYNLWKRDLDMLDEVGVHFYSYLTVSCGAEDLTFPPGFKFGVATSAYQIEGAWNVSDKGESIWDRFTHARSDRIKDHSNGDVACDSYNHWKRDVEMVSELGVHFYRFSISWTRLLPNGFTNHISEDGKKYYSDLLDALLEKGIEPMVTLYHWDLPQRLQELGGWTNPLVSDWFADYARVAFTLYADRVKTWITINEPVIICDVPYNVDELAPAIKGRDVGYLLCGKHVLLAHAKAWRIYDEEFRGKYGGQIALTNHFMWVEPRTPQDKNITDLVMKHLNGRYSYPIFSKEGGWPPLLAEHFAAYSKKQGFPRSTLPSLSQKEIDLIRGTYDFFAFNMYVSRQVSRAEDGEVLEPWPIGSSPELNAKLGFDPKFKIVLDGGLFTMDPESLRKALVYFKKEYGDLPYFLAENGFSSKKGLQDTDKIEYYQAYLKQLLLAIKEDGVNVTGYTAWSLMDNFEWQNGYTAKFGLYEVDFESPMRTRTPRASALYYTSIVKSHSLNVSTDISMASMPPRSSTKDQDSSSSTVMNYVLIAIGVLLIVVAVGVAIYVAKLRRKQSEPVRKGSYVSVKLDDKPRERELTQ